MSMTTCPYCGNLIVDDQEGSAPEHVIPSAIRGNLEVPCGAKCNRLMGKHFDYPILNDRRVLIRRAVYGVRPKYRDHDPSRIGIPGQLSADGGRAIWRPGDPDNTVTMVAPSEVTDHGSGHFSFVSPVEKHEAHAARVMRQLEDANPGKTAKLIESVETVDDETRFEHTWGIGASLWPRFAAKVALCLGGLTFGESWLGTVESGMLRGLLWRDKTYKNMFPDGFALPVMPTEMGFDEDGLQARLFSLLLPTEHYLAVFSTPEGAVQFVISLFGGELQYRLVINSQETVPAHGRAWLLDGKGKASATANDSLIASLVAREDDLGPTAQHRRELPHPKVVGVVRSGQLTTPPS